MISGPQKRAYSEKTMGLAPSFNRVMRQNDCVSVQRLLKKLIVALGNFVPHMFTYVDPDPHES